MAAWGGAVVAYSDDARDLGEGQSGCLRGADEPQPGECGVVVDAVSVLGAFGVGQEPFAFIEPYGSGWDAEGVGELSDQHVLMLPLDLLLWEKVYGDVRE